MQSFRNKIQLPSLQMPNVRPAQNKQGQNRATIPNRGAPRLGAVPPKVARFPAPRSSTGYTSANRVPLGRPPSISLQSSIPRTPRGMQTSISQPSSIPYTSPLFRPPGLQQQPVRTTQPTFASGGRPFLHPRVSTANIARPMYTTPAFVGIAQQRPLQPPRASLGQTSYIRSAAAGHIAASNSGHQIPSIIGRRTANQQKQTTMTSSSTVHSYVPVSSLSNLTPTSTTKPSVAAGKMMNLQGLSKVSGSIIVTQGSVKWISAEPGPKDSTGTISTTAASSNVSTIKNQHKSFSWSDASKSKACDSTASGNKVVGGSSTSDKQQSLPSKREFSKDYPQVFTNVEFYRDKPLGRRKEFKAWKYFLPPKEKITRSVDSKSATKAELSKDRRPLCKRTEFSEPSGGPNNRYQGCPVPTCDAQTKRLKTHVLENHVPDCLKKPSATPGLAHNTQRKEAFEWLAKTIVSPVATINDLVKYLNDSKCIPSKSEFTKEDIFNMTAMCKSLNWFIPSKFELHPINSPSVLLFWRCLAHMVSFLSPEDQERFAKENPHALLNDTEKKSVSKSEQTAFNVSWSSKFSLQLRIDNESKLTSVLPSKSIGTSSTSENKSQMTAEKNESQVKTAGIGSVAAGNRNLLKANDKASYTGPAETSSSSDTSHWSGLQKVMKQEKPLTTNYKALNLAVQKSLSTSTKQEKATYGKRLTLHDRFGLCHKRNFQKIFSFGKIQESKPAGVRTEKKNGSGMSDTIAQKDRQNVLKVQDPTITQKDRQNVLKAQDPRTQGVSQPTWTFSSSDKSHWSALEKVMSLKQGKPFTVEKSPRMAHNTRPTETYSLSDNNHWSALEKTMKQGHNLTVMGVEKNLKAWDVKMLIDSEKGENTPPERLGREGIRVEREENCMDRKDDRKRRFDDRNDVNSFRDREKDFGGDRMKRSRFEDRTDVHSLEVERHRIENYVSDIRREMELDRFDRLNKGDLERDRWISNRRYDDERFEKRSERDTYRERSERDMYVRQDTYEDDGYRRGETSDLQRERSRLNDDRRDEHRYRDYVPDDRNDSFRRSRHLSDDSDLYEPRGGMNNDRRDIYDERSTQKWDIRNARSDPYGETQFIDSRDELRETGQHYRNRRENMFYEDRGKGDMLQEMFQRDANNSEREFYQRRYESEDRNKGDMPREMFQRDANNSEREFYDRRCESEDRNKGDMPREMFQRDANNSEREFFDRRYESEDRNKGDMHQEMFQRDANNSEREFYQRRYESEPNATDRFSPDAKIHDQRQEYSLAFDSYMNLHETCKEIWGRTPTADPLGKILDHKPVRAPRQHVRVINGVVVFDDPSCYPRIEELGIQWSIALGVHPRYAPFLTEDQFQDLRHALLNSRRKYALGVIGLDMSEHRTYWEFQRDTFSRLLDLASPNRPIILYVRGEAGDINGSDAYIQCFSIVKSRCSFKQKIHIHSFMGSVDDADMWMSHFPDCYFGFTGATVDTFSREQENALRRIPDDRLLLESGTPGDCVKGNPVFNFPAHIGDLAAAVASIKDRSMSYILRRTLENGRELYD